MVARAKKTAPVKVSPNGDTPKTFTYTPKGNSCEPIVLPVDGFELPSIGTPEDRVWLYDYNELPLHEQVWIWLRRANVDRAVAHRVVSLPMTEQFDMVNDWLKVKAGVSVGE